MSATPGYPPVMPGPQVTGAWTPPGVHITVPAPVHPLAHTGAPIVDLLWLAVALIAVGVVALLTRRRER